MEKKDKMDKITSPAAKQPFIGRSVAEAIYRATRIYPATACRLLQLPTAIACCLLLLAAAGCSADYLETQPTTATVTDEIFADTQTAEMALNGIYRHFYQYLGSHDQGGHFAVMHAIDLMGEDLFPKQQGYGWFVSDYNYTGSRNVNSSRVAYYWSFYYDIINSANLIIEQLPGVAGTDAEKNNLLGQALALRAFGHFMEVQLFAKTYEGNEDAPGVPVYTQHTSTGKARATVGEVYSQIVADLDTAIVKLTGAPSRPNKSYINIQVAQGLRARVALVMNDWQTAETCAKKARTGFALMSTDDYLDGFNSAGNTEWIWGSIINDEQTIVLASLYSHLDPSAGGYATVGNEKHILKTLYDAMQNNDVRKAAFLYNYENSPAYNYWTVKFYLPSPNSWAGDYVYMRAAEMYLIEAEAIARQGGRSADAGKLLETLVQARGVEGYALTAFATGEALLEEIYLQRRIELWGEGFRWLDLKRQKKPLARQTGANPGLHNGPLAMVTDIPVDDPRWTMLIPQGEIDANPNIIQNEL
jgi:hypothetical protein